MSKYITSIFILFALNSHLFGEEIEAPVNEQRPVLRVGISGNLPGSININGQYAGIIVDTYQDLVKELKIDYQLEYVVAGARRLKQELLAKNIDLLIYGRDEVLFENAVIVYIPPLRDIGLWSLSENPVNPDGNLDGLRIAAPRSYTRKPKFKNAEILAQSASRSSIKMLASKRVDAIVSQNMIFKYRVSELGIDIKQFTNYVIDQTPNFLWTYKGSLVDKNLAAWQEAAKVTITPELIEKRWEKVIELNKKINE